MKHAKTFLKVSRTPAPSAPATGVAAPSILPVLSTVEARAVDAAPDAPPGDRGFSAEQRRELAAIHGTLACPVRQDIFWALASAGRTHVNALCQKTGLKPRAASRHLAPLNHRRLVFAEREGLHVYYTLNPALVRFDRGGDRPALTIAHPSGVEVTDFGPPTAATRKVEPPAAPA